MSSITDKIKSIQSQVGASYTKPDPKKLEKMQMMLQGNDTAREYLEITRGLSKDTIKHFGLGYDSVRNAIAIPVFKRGELINIKYRLLDPGDRPKYTQERDAEVWIYNEDGIQKALKLGSVLIVEGEFDLMSAWQNGFTNVISPASGKDSYGVWLELLDNIPRIYIAYDNDKPGKGAALKMAERIGMEKCQEIIYTGDIKDANDYFKKHTKEEFRQLIKDARPFYTYQFKGVGDVINDLRFNKGEYIKLKYLPDVKISPDYLIVVSGKTNVGKTSYVMNLAKEMVEDGIPVLVLPFERGPQVVGTRFLQVKYNFSEGDFSGLQDETWDKVTKECMNTPLYFAMPTKEETYDLIAKSKRIFNTRVVIIDHLDYMIRSTQNKEAEIGNTLQELKRLAEEHQIVMIIVTHIRKIESAGSARKKKPNMDDLKGSSSLSQDPECVVMLTSPESGQMEVDVIKNKGKMGSKIFGFNVETGTMSTEIIEERTEEQKALDDDWDSL